MKGSHPRPADQCPFVVRHSISQVTSFMQLGMSCICDTRGRWVKHRSAPQMCLKCLCKHRDAQIVYSEMIVAAWLKTTLLFFFYIRPIAPRGDCKSGVFLSVSGRVGFLSSCYLNWVEHITWWPHQMEIFSALLAICAGNSPVPGEFPAQRPVTRSFDVFLDLRLKKRLSKQSWGWWFETLSRPLWRHRNEICLPAGSRGTSCPSVAPCRACVTTCPGGSPSTVPPPY